MIKNSPIKAIAAATALTLLPACTHSNSSTNNSQQTTSVSEGPTTSDATSHDKGESWEMSCTDGTRITFNGGLDGNITVADLPKEGVHTYQEDEKHFNAVANVIIPVTPETGDSALSSINTGGPINAYGYQTSRTLMFDRETRKTHGQAQWQVSIPKLFNGKQLARFSFFGINDLYESSAGEEKDKVGEKYEADGSNFVMVFDSEKRGGLVLANVPKDPSSPTGFAREATVTDLSKKTQADPFTLTFDVPGPNGAPGTIDCDFYSFQRGKAEPPSIGKGPLTF